MRKDQSGQGLVELILVFPLLLLVLLGIIDFGRVYFAYVTITNASREGARYASSCPSDLVEIKNRVVRETSGLVEIRMDDITVYPSGGEIAVRVANDFRASFFAQLPFVRDYFTPGGVLTIRAQTVMPIISTC